MWGYKAGLHKSNRSEVRSAAIQYVMAADHIEQNQFGCDIKFDRILLSHFKGFVGNICCQHVGIRNIDCNGHGDRARTCTYIGNSFFSQEISVTMQLLFQRAILFQGGESRHPV